MTFNMSSEEPVTAVTATINEQPTPVNAVVKLKKEKRYPSFSEFMKNSTPQTPEGELLIAAIAKITTLPGNTYKTPNKVYNEIVGLAKKIYE